MLGTAGVYDPHLRRLLFPAPGEQSKGVPVIPPYPATRSGRLSGFLGKPDNCGRYKDRYPATSKACDVLAILSRKVRDVTAQHAALRRDDPRLVARLVTAGDEAQDEDGYHGYTEATHGGEHSHGRLSQLSVPFVHINGVAGLGRLSCLVSVSP